MREKQKRERERNGREEDQRGKRERKDSQFAESLITTVCITSIAGHRSHSHYSLFLSLSLSFCHYSLSLFL